MEVDDGEVMSDSENEETSSTLMPTLPCANEPLDESVTAHELVCMHHACIRIRRCNSNIL